MSLSFSLHVASTPLSSIRLLVRDMWPDIVNGLDLSKEPQVMEDGTRVASPHAQAMNALPKTPKLLGSSHKVELQNEELGVLSSVVYLAPDNELFGAGSDDKRTTCPHASEECSALCLGHKSGRMIMSPNKRARLWKAALFFGARDLFTALLIKEARALSDKATKLGKLGALRVDGSSDTGLGQKLSSLFYEEGLNLRLWDYTKSISRVKSSRETLDREGWYAAPSGSFTGGGSYSLTFSYSGYNLDDCRVALELGFPVAVVFDTPKGEALPDAWERYPVIDGDVLDQRFFDRRNLGAPQSGGYIVGLRLKSATDRAQAIETGARFVVDAKEAQAIADHGLIHESLCTPHLLNW